MTDLERLSPNNAWLDTGQTARLSQRIDSGLRRARSSGRPALVSVSAPTAPAADPSAVVTASRRPGEMWFCFEQPDRHATALAALGCVRALEATGPTRFAEVERQWRALAGSAMADTVDGVSGAGLVALGGFSFAPAGGRSKPWEGFASASLIVPEVSFARSGSRSYMTVNAVLAPDDSSDDVLGRLERRLAELRQGPMPMLDPAPTGAFEVSSTMPPSHYEEAVARAVAQIADGALEKVVLAREVEVLAPTEHDPAAIFGLLREGFPSCFVFAVGRGDATFIGASPELLVRREGARASTVALAGSTRRSADPAVDDHLGEQLLRSQKDREENAIVGRRIAQALRPHSVWVTAASEPVLVRVANIQHLAAPIRAQLARPLGAIELAGLLHPTPAVGGEPWEPAERMIPALEGIDRGWYAGPIGWSDATGDGEFCVALRCALLRGRHARLYAGAGIVRDSDPASELAETEVKLQALLPVLAG